MDIIRKTNLSEAVTQQLLASISNGDLKAGDKLPSEAELCNTFGVSRTALREGIKALAGMNVLTVLPGRGTFVTENPDIMVSSDALKAALSRETINSLYEARYALDAGIARFAAFKADEEDIKALQKAVDKMEGAVSSDPADIQLASEADEEFHLAFCKASHNKILENMARPVITHAMIRIWKRLRGSSQEFGRAAVEGHKEILAALEKRDVRMVVDAVEKHLKAVFEIIGND